MKLSDKAVNALKEFSTINPSIAISKGNVLKTVSPSKTIVAKTTVDDNFPVENALHNLTKFLGVVSIMDDPDFDFKSDHVVISDKNKYVTKMYYASIDTIVAAPKKDIVLPSTDAAFLLKGEAINKIHRAASVLQVPEVVITGADGTITVSAEDVSNKSGDTFKLDLGDTDTDFRVVFKVENLKVQQLDYTVTVSSKGLAHFENDDREYWIATEVRKS